MLNIHGRLEWCPRCNPPVKLQRANLTATTARKGCPNCKRKFDFTRTDTPEGRKQRTAEWRRKRDIQVSRETEKVEKEKQLDKDLGL